MKKTYHLKIESKEFYKNINELIQPENSNVRWNPDKQYSGFFVNGEFRLSETIGMNPFYLNRLNYTVIYGNYSLEKENIQIDANFKLKYRKRTLLIAYSLGVLFVILSIFHGDIAVIIVTLLFLIMIPIVDRIATGRKLRIGIMRFEEAIVEKIKKFNC